MAWVGECEARRGDRGGRDRGRKHRGRLRRLIAGSGSDSVVRHARCPVLVVSPGALRGSWTGRFEAAG
ncbi:MAG: universal stress protein [Actinomycetota bacterium]|nr:universal stress protein [Actinomycetota bacterium]